MKVRLAAVAINARVEVGGAGAGRWSTVGFGFSGCVVMIAILNFCFWVVVLCGGACVCGLPLPSGFWLLNLNMQRPTKPKPQSALRLGMFEMLVAVRCVDVDVPSAYWNRTISLVMVADPAAPVAPASSPRSRSPDRRDHCVSATRCLP